MFGVKALSRTSRLCLIGIVGIIVAGYPIWATAKALAASDFLKSRPTISEGVSFGANDNRPTKVNSRDGPSPEIRAQADPKSSYALKADLGTAVVQFENRDKQAGAQFSAGNSALGFFLRGSADSTVKKTSKNSVAFEKGDMRVVYTIDKSTVKEEIILDKKPSHTEWVFDYNETGLRREAGPDGGWQYFNEAGEEVFCIPTATVSDANGATGTVTMTIKDSELILAVDEAFLQKAAYPVVIDPTVVATAAIDSATSYTNSRKLVKTKSGAFFLLYQSGSGLAYKVSTDTGNSWGAPTMLSPTTRSEASIVIDGDDNIYAVYSDNTATDTVAFRKLISTGAATWTIGGETIVTSETAPRHPSVQRESGGRIWVSFRYSDANIYARYSDDDGASWSASANLGTSHAAGSALLVPYQGYTAVIYEPNATSLAWRYWNGASWSPAQTIVSGTNIEDYNFSAAVTRNNDIHLIYAEGSAAPQFIRYTYFDGASWSLPVDITTDTGDRCPQLTTNGRDVWAFWSRYIGFNQYQMVYKKDSGGVWDATSTVFTPASEQQFQQVWTQKNGSVWSDETADASSTAADDVPFFSTNDDSLYAGQSEKFDYIYFDMTVGASVNTAPIWEYWNGSAWTALTITENPTYGFTADGNIRFTPPSDWAVTAVNGSQPGYFIRATRTVTGLSTKPVAGQLTAVKNNIYPMTILKDTDVTGITWSEGIAPNCNALFQPFTVSTTTLDIDSTYNRDGTTGTASNDFGTASPLDSPFVIHTDAAKHAIQLTIGSDIDWDLLVTASGDLTGGGKTIPIERLSWRAHGSSDAWISFSTTQTAIMTSQLPASADTTRLDYQLVTNWDDDPETYQTTIYYTALPSP